MGARTSGPPNPDHWAPKPVRVFHLPPTPPEPGDLGPGKQQTGRLVSAGPTTKSFYPGLLPVSSPGLDTKLT